MSTEVVAGTQAAPLPGPEDKNIDGNGGTRGPKAPGRRRRRRHLLPYLLVLPAALAILVVQVGPMVIGAAMSFLRLNEFTIGNWVKAPFAGLENFRIALNFNEPVARGLLDSWGVTCAYTVVVVGVSWVLGMVAAVFLTDDFKLRRWVRSIMIVPYAIPIYIGVSVWTFMFQPSGAINTLLGHDLHLVNDNTFWLVGTSAFWSMAVTAIWRTWPFAFLLLLASLQGIPPELYEAARVDGASAWQEFRRVTLPSVRRVSLLLILVTGFWTFNDFTTPFIMFSTAPPSSASLLSLEIYVNSFVDLNFGLGAAMSLLMIIFVILMAMVYMRALRFKVGDQTYA